MITFFFFNDTATTEIYTLSLHDALPIYPSGTAPRVDAGHDLRGHELQLVHPRARGDAHEQRAVRADALGARARGDLGSDEIRPLGDDLGLPQSLGEARPRQIAAQRLGDGDRKPLFALAHGPLTKRATGRPVARRGRAARASDNPPKIPRSCCQRKTY